MTTDPDTQLLAFVDTMAIEAMPSTYVAGDIDPGDEYVRVTVGSFTTAGEFDADFSVWVPASDITAAADRALNAHGYTRNGHWQRSPFGYGTGLQQAAVTRTGDQR